MVDALKTLHSSSKGVLLHQLLHGYSDGHRLIESSFRPQDDLTRLMLRMSDISGNGMVPGFEEYLTGYPLPSIDSYALAKTWSAPEMPRPGCVWTHTIVIRNEDLANLNNLAVLSELFSRPIGTLKGDYKTHIEFSSHSSDNTAHDFIGPSELQSRRILKSYYENPDKGLLIPAVNAKEFE